MPPLHGDIVAPPHHPSSSKKDVVGSKIYYDGYKVDKGSKDLEGYALADPGFNGICELAPVPDGMSRIFFKQHFLSMHEGAKENRLRAIGTAISIVTSPADPQKQEKVEAPDGTFVICA
ncbi:hypothetical protein CGRA01v4_14003 [Colletotrichum graminicola]|uniref:Uncharacterized protein n=1 Tax=Colletotrichum graminicola (strain M1.001 / M2 / FGSC 10212) TaxID=645133 RepID=E3QYE3_COLGM|nr:uncharacterized protein GLRG_11072 [Colletotrichum graminicola M1.001]EFQ35881.1 hypothetical protein GLRG_11072 [Colletotrichum graminicola M1.001]WDK22713.1 hypothetical protein CGRA01v4_14003 [Colletotrichum graminicola]